MKTSSIHARAIWFVVTLWLLLVCAFGSFGATLLIQPWARGPLVVLALLAPYLAYLLHRPTRAALDGIPDATLIALHVWRAVAGFAFLYWGGLGLLPPLFVRNAAYGDIVVAILVPLVLTLPESRWTYLGFHVLGFADLLLAVGTGLYLTVGGESLMNDLFAFPLVLIPFFGVPVSGAAHLIALTRLLCGEGERT